MDSDKQFKLELDSDWFNGGDILHTYNEETTLRVLSTPTKKKHQWWYRILNWLTFGYFFNIEYRYTVEIIEEESTCKDFLQV